MGGVATSDNGASHGSNVAFRAVPKGTTWGSIPLPIGIVQYVKNPATFDPSDPKFNVFELLDLAANPPMTWSLGNRESVSGDISIFVAKDSLQVDLADIQRAVPNESMKYGGVYHLFGIGKRFGSLFIQVNPILHIRNDFNLSDQLRASLRYAVPFVGNTRYGLNDDGVAQTAIAFQAGFAFRALHGSSLRESDLPDPRRNGATALYVGAGPKYLMGLAYGRVGSEGGITTGDTLFASSNPVAMDLSGTTRYAAVGGSGGMGRGYGADLGAVLFWNNFELGVGVSDAGSQIHWSTTLNRFAYDDSLNKIVNVVESERDGFWSRIPATTTVSIAKRIGPTTAAADVVENELHTALHVGLETWFGMLALRGGTYRDTNARWQWTGGTGIRFGVIGLDAAVGSHSRNVEEERSLELCTSLTIY